MTFAVSDRRGRIIRRTRRAWLARFTARLHRDSQVLEIQEPFQW